jgi:hypothetical protein
VADSGAHIRPLDGIRSAPARRAAGAQSSTWSNVSFLVFRDGQLSSMFAPGWHAPVAAIDVPEIVVDVDALFAAADRA